MTASMPASASIPISVNRLAATRAVTSAGPWARIASERRTMSVARM